MGNRLVQIVVCGLCALMLLPFFGCKTLPIGDAPTLEFDRVEAANIGEMTLYFRMYAENTRDKPLQLSVRHWKLILNGITSGSEKTSLFIDGSPAHEQKLSLAPGESVEKMLSLRLNTKDYSGIKGDDYHAELKLDLSWRYGKARALNSEVSTVAIFPRVREPEFTILSIAIMKAELINTRFKVSLQIDNPNPFPVSLSAFGYELYGDGQFWANGKEKDVMFIPAHGSTETKLFLLMNFINMKRSLLDEVIAMRHVQYRFTGAADVTTEVDWLPQFNMTFDRNGKAEVID